jgi:hypothetical protein
LPLGDISLPAVAETLSRVRPREGSPQKLHGKEELRKMMRKRVALKVKGQWKDEVAGESHFPADFVSCVVLAAGADTSGIVTRQNRVQLFLKYFVGEYVRGSSGVVGEYTRVASSRGSALRRFRKNCAISFSPKDFGFAPGVVDPGRRFS